MSFENWEEEKYNEVFDEVYSNLETIRKKDPTYTIENLQALLDSLYVQEGSDWEGRGGVYAIANSATIAACETMVVNWREELDKQ